MDATIPKLPPQRTAVPTRARRRPLRSRLSAGHVLMIVTGVVAALLNLVALRGGDSPARIAVVARDLPAGASLDAAALRWLDVQADAELVGTLIEPATLPRYARHVTVRPLAAGDPLRRSDLRATPGDGRRAMSIPVDPARAVGGDLAPGDRVDLIEAAEGRVRYLASGVEVLAITVRGEGALGSITTPSVTVAVDDRTALALAAAIQGGAIHVVRATGAPAPTVTELAPAAGPEEG